jgi:hypothetical protein
MVSRGRCSTSRSAPRLFEIVSRAHAENLNCFELISGLLSKWPVQLSRSIKYEFMLPAGSPQPIANPLV